MQKRGRLVLIVLILLTTFLLSACSGQVNAGETPRDTAAVLREVQSGTQGVELEFINDFPPKTIYDQDELIAIVEINNKGNHDLAAEACFVEVTGHDPSIITGAFGSPRSCAENIGVLEGKNVYNTQGGINQIEFHSGQMLLDDGVFEYNPTLNFLTCYNYQTTANPEVCVDTQRYQVTSEQKACDYRQSVSVGGGQGGPVGISYVGMDMVGERAIFDITVRNFGSGRVLSPFSDILGCGQASLGFDDVDKVLYNVHLSGGSLISCKPFDGLVRLHNDQGKIQCQFLIPGTAAFKTPLRIELDYNYIESEQKQVKIVATPR